MISVHILVGALLIPLVLLKTATTGWRIARYYLGSDDYRQAGPPPLLLRVLGPLVVLAGLAVLGSGLALIALGSGTFTPIGSVAGFSVNALTVHQASFIAWLVITGLHVLTRTVPAVQLAQAEPRHTAARSREPLDAAASCSSAPSSALRSAYWCYTSPAVGPPVTSTDSATTFETVSTYGAEVSACAAE